MVTIPSKGELAILYGGPNLVYLIRLDGDSAIQTARGIVSSKDCIGKPFGTKVYNDLHRFQWGNQAIGLYFYLLSRV